MPEEPLVPRTGVGEVDAALDAAGGVSGMSLDATLVVLSQLQQRLGMILDATRAGRKGAEPPQGSDGPHVDGPSAN